MSEQVKEQITCQGSKKNGRQSVLCGQPATWKCEYPSAIYKDRRIVTTHWCDYHANYIKSHNKSGEWTNIDSKFPPEDEKEK